MLIRSNLSVKSFPFIDSHNGSFSGSVSRNFNSFQLLRNYGKPSKCDHCVASVSVSASCWWMHSGRFHDIKVNCVSFLKRPFHCRCIMPKLMSAWIGWIDLLSSQISDKTQLLFIRSSIQVSYNHFRCIKKERFTILSSKLHLSPGKPWSSSQC